MNLWNISKNLPFIKTEALQFPCHISTYEEASTEPPHIKIIIKPNNDEQIFLFLNRTRFARFLRRQSTQYWNTMDFQRHSLV
jgi:hypothetical protein